MVGSQHFPIFSAANKVQRNAPYINHFPVVPFHKWWFICIADNLISSLSIEDILIKFQFF